MTILKNAFPLMIQQPSVADPDRQLRRVRESFTAELFLLLSREMRKDRSSSPRRPESATVAPLHVLHGAYQASMAVSSARRHLGPTTRARRTDNRPSRAYFSFNRRVARSARRVPTEILPILLQMQCSSRTCCCTFTCSCWAIRGHEKHA